MVHATPTLAVAVVALSAVSTMAIPNYGAGDFIDARDIYDDNALAARGFFDRFRAKKTAASTNAAQTTPSTSSAAGHRAGDALPTVTRHLRAKPTACKVGQKPSWPVHSSRSQALAAPAAAPPQLAARSATPVANDAGAITRPTPAPHAAAAEPASHVIGTRTTTGKNGEKTVVHVLPPTRTRCFATTPTGAAASGSRVERLPHHHHGNAKLLARAAGVLAEYINQLD